MAIDWDSDVLAPCHDAFGESATYSPQGGAAPFSVEGVFLNGFTQNVALIDGSVGVNTVQPVFAVRTSLFGSTPPKRNDKITVLSNGATYVIRDIQPDGVGELRCQLQRTDPL